MKTAIITFNDGTMTQIKFSDLYSLQDSLQRLGWNINDIQTIKIV